jgi:hypothetical protein
MNTQLLLLAMAALLGAVGCATLKGGAAGDYERGNVSTSQFTKDGDTCAKQAEADQKQFGMGGENDPTHSTYNRMFDACMRASGYPRKQAPD